MSDGLRYINLTVVVNDWICSVEFFGSESFVGVYVEFLV